MAEGRLIAMRTLAAALAGALLCAGGPCERARAEDGRAFVLFVENDVWAGEDGDYTDRHYTAGNYGFVRRAEGRVSPWARAALSPLLRLGEGADAAVYESWGFGQALFTPEDIRALEPDPADRPYAGWLRLMHVLSRAHDGMIDTVSLEAGWVGPEALGKEVQRAHHFLIEEKDPKGWRSQLASEPTLQASFERKWARGEIELGRLEADVRPKAQAVLGNAFIHAGGGVEARLGVGLEDDYGPPRLGPATPYPGFTRADPPGCVCYLYLGVEGRYVARDLFIEGNTFGGVETALELEPWTADFRFGAVIERGRWGVGFSHVLRTEEFEGQVRHQQFGLISVTRRY